MSDNEIHNLALRAIARAISALATIEDVPMTIDNILEAARISTEAGNDSLELDASTVKKINAILNSSRINRLVIIMMTGQDPAAAWPTPIDYTSWCLQHQIQKIVSTNHRANTGKFVSNTSYNPSTGFSFTELSVKGAAQVHPISFQQVYTAVCERVIKFGNKHAQFIGAMFADISAEIAAVQAAAAYTASVILANKAAVAAPEQFLTVFKACLFSFLPVAAPTPAEDSTAVQLLAMTEQIKALKAENEVLKAEMQSIRAAKTVKAERDEMQAAARRLAEQGPTRSYAEVSAAASSTAAPVQSKPFLNAVKGQVSKVVCTGAGGGK